MVYASPDSLRRPPRDDQQNDWHGRSRRDFHRRRGAIHARQQDEQKKSTVADQIGKAIVFGLLDRETGKVRTSVVSTRRKNKSSSAKFAATSRLVLTLYTDALKSYDGLDSEYAHKVIDHAEAYVDGAVHTNRLENFWSLLKRSIKGTYVSVEPFHLFRYLR